MQESTIFSYFINTTEIVELNLNVDGMSLKIHLSFMKSTMVFIKTCESLPLLNEYSLYSYSGTLYCHYLMNSGKTTA